MFCFSHARRSVEKRRRPQSCWTLRPIELPSPRFFFALSNALAMMVLLFTVPALNALHTTCRPTPWDAMRKITAQFLQKRRMSVSASRCWRVVDVDSRIGSRMFLLAWLCCPIVTTVAARGREKEREKENGKGKGKGSEGQHATRQSRAQSLLPAPLSPPPPPPRGRGANTQRRMVDAQPKKTNVTHVAHRPA